MASGFAEVRFKGTRKAYFAFADLEILPGAAVVVEADFEDKEEEVFW